MNTLNTRILIIDDEESIRDSFVQILSPKKIDTRELSAAEDALFDDTPSTLRQPQGTLFEYEVDTASTGKEGEAKVRAALESKRPYAVIFCDMRMPGWDGLSTVTQIRKSDQRAEIVFVTAYSDYSIDEIVEKSGPNVSYFCKPFSPDEIRQLATKTVYEWNKASSLESLISVITNLRGQRGHMDQLLNNILAQVADLLGSRSAMIAHKNEKGAFELISATGLLLEPNASQNYLNLLPSLTQNEFFQSETYACFPMQDYSVVALFETDAPPINTERSYIVRLFLEQAAQTLENVMLQEQLLHKEKLSAVGQAISMAAHDIRGPIGAIQSALELADLDPDSSELQAEAQGIITEAAEQAMEIVNDILDFVKNESIDTGPVSFDKILVKVERLLAPVLKDTSVAFSVTHPAGIKVLADDRKLLRVLFNLCKNAVEALGHSHLENPKVEIHLATEGEQVKISVIDNGKGIPEKLLSNLFEPFASKGKVGGNGLGLPIVKQIVERHGSQINVETGTQGTCFHFTLPRVQS
jgi:signal transduction histidine kinase